jgi:hypothetical protein
LGSTGDELNWEKGFTDLVEQNPGFHRPISLPRTSKANLLIRFISGIHRAIAPWSNRSSYPFQPDLTWYEFWSLVMVGGSSRHLKEWRSYKSAFNPIGVDSQVSRDAQVICLAYPRRRRVEGIVDVADRGGNQRPKKLFLKGIWRALLRSRI